MPYVGPEEEKDQSQESGHRSTGRAPAPQPEQGGSDWRKEERRQKKGIAVAEGIDAEARDQEHDQNGGARVGEDTPAGRTPLPQIDGADEEEYPEEEQKTAGEIRAPG